jgi:hypothetical protein
LTSFEQPNASLLVEHLLPALLNMRDSLTEQSQERIGFFGELGPMLEALHGRITVISSPPRAQREDTQYPWLWRYVDLFTVGAQSHAVQHAKLWAFHWQAGDKDILDLYISSANLTMSAFKAQIQAGWRVSLTLDPRGTRDNRRSWGNLIPFLNALGTSAGDVAAARIERLVALLGRAACPAGITFIASIPDSRSVANQLKQFEASALHVLTPSIGDWSNQTLSVWSEDAGIAPHKIHLKWIAENHPWAMAGGWQISTAASRILQNNGVRLECLPHETRLTDPHRSADSRWSHAKLYLLRSRRKRWLLVTSANWSIAAWGAGKKQPRNFELGVIFETEWTDLEALGKPFDPPDTVPFCCERPDVDHPGAALEWAQVCWNGKWIQLRARSADAARIIAAVVFTDGSRKSIVLNGDGTGELSWEDPERTPLLVQFTQDGKTREVYVIDLRPPAEFKKTPLPEVDSDYVQDLRAAFLLQRYGGPAVDPESIAESVNWPRQPDGQTVASVITADYSVQAWIEARRAFDVIKNWQTALDKAKSDLAIFEQVYLDGQDLLAYYEKRPGAADSLAADEFGWRLEENA